MKLIGSYKSRERALLIRQLAAITLGVALVYASRLFIAVPGENLNPLYLTVAVTTVTSLLGVLLIRALNRYPGTESYAATLSGMSVAYAVTTVILLLARIDYARGQLFGTYFLTVTLLFALEIRWPTRKKLRVAVIEGDEPSHLHELAVDAVSLVRSNDPLPPVDAVTVDLRGDLSPDWQRRIVELALSDVPVLHVKHLRESLTGRVELEHLSETSYGTLSPPLGYILLKRCADFTISVVLLALLLPALLLIAAAVAMDSPGGPIFRQSRVGYRGKVFVVWKFRSMQNLPHPAECDVQHSAERVFLHDEKRITRVGSFLRRSRLDELPQLLNVIRGEMSLIGPRPETVELSRIYEKRIPFYRYRHVVLPGITGWAQINQGHVEDVTDASSKLHYDFYYIKNLSPWLDALISVRTIIVMVTGRGAR